MIIAISGKIGSGKDTVGKIIQYLTTQEINKHTLNKPVKTSLTYQEFRNNFTTPVMIESSWEIKKFAGKLKQIVSLLSGIPVEDLEKQEIKNSNLGNEWRRAGWKVKGFIDAKDYESITVRHLLQVLGTNAIRDIVHPNAWVNALFVDYQKLCQRTNTVKCTLPCYNSQEEYQCKRFPNWIITDMRFPNELKAIEDRDGITIRINRKSFNRFCKNCLKEYNLIKGLLNCPNCDSLNTASVFQEPSTHPSETALDNAEFKYTINNDGTIEELVEKVKEILIKEKII